MQNIPDNITVAQTTESFPSPAFVPGIHRWPVNSPHTWPVTRKIFPFDDVIMNLVLPRLCCIPCSLYDSSEILIISRWFQASRIGWTSCPFPVKFTRVIGKCRALFCLQTQTVRAKPLLLIPHILIPTLHLLIFLSKAGTGCYEF